MVSSLSAFVSDLCTYHPKSTLFKIAWSVIYIPCIIPKNHSFVLLFKCPANKFSVTDKLACHLLAK